MDNRILIGFFVFLAIFLVLPFAAQQLRTAQAPAGAAGGAVTATSPGTNAPPVNPELNQPPLLNEANLIGSEWQVQVEQYKVKITLAAGGVCYATHPLAKAITGVDYLEGRWRLTYDQLYVNTAFGGKEYNTTLKVSGSNLYYVNPNNGSFDKVLRFQ